MLLVGREVDYVEFMAVRKIPLKERPRFASDGEPLSQDDMDTDVNDAEEDPEVRTVMEAMRKKALTDRALHDKVIYVSRPWLLSVCPSHARH